MAETALKRLRIARGLTQQELADRAGVSRQRLAAAEAGRHQPSVDAALRLARALGESVEGLFGSPSQGPVLLLSPIQRGEAVRVGRVGDALVASSLVGSGPRDLFAGADGFMGGAGIELVEGDYDGLVVSGCDPALRVAERLLSGLGRARLVAFQQTTGEAVDALGAGLVHGCLVHGPAHSRPRPPVPVRRWELGRWQAGIGFHADLGRPSLEQLVSGGVEVAQRPESAVCQQALRRAVVALDIGGPVPGPVVASHLDSAERAAIRRGAAVTMEPAAIASRLGFIPLEEHTVELWIAARWIDHPGTSALVDVLNARRFRDRLALIGGYDVSHSGTELTAA